MTTENDDMGGPFKAHQIRLWRHLDGVGDPYESIAHHCNLLLKELMADGIVVYQYKQGPDGKGVGRADWSTYIDEDFGGRKKYSHTAIIPRFTIRELKEEKE